MSILTYSSIKETIMTFLITGATGTVGSRVVELLLLRGQRPRIFVRNAEKARARYGDQVDIAVGDLNDTSSLSLALKEADSLFLITSGPNIAKLDEAAAKAAKCAGAKHLVKLSSMDAQQNIGTGAWHVCGEAAIRASGIPFTFVQPTGFMSNALEWASSIKAGGVVRAPTGDGKIPFIHAADIAAVATEVLTTTKYLGESLPITGPRALSYAEMTEQIAAAIGKPLRFEAVSDEYERQKMTKGDAPEPIIDAHISIYRSIREGRMAKVTDNVENVLRRKPLSFAQWVQENAATFR
jgi:(4-alkanoyl-5-oxo-2,5-dihydrofuran-3-yl)methyl phosphate reductase